jgi:hypothetical protein
MTMSGSQQPLIGDPGHDRPRQHQTEAAADAEQRRHQADAAGNSLAGQPVPDDREGQRVDAARRALDHPSGDELTQIARDRADSRAGRERGQAGQHHAPLTRHLAETADNRGEDQPEHPWRPGGTPLLTRGGW